MVGMGVNRVETPLGDLLLEEVAERFDNSSNSILVDGSLLHYPLSVRPKREGDYFYPLGMRGKKKLSKYFKDEKLSLADKEKCLLLCSGEDIVWVLGRRADDRFKVTENTKKILKIELQ
jgi:tRNA(Ile)-lysidine synthase